MTIQDKAGGKLAILSKPMDTRPKMLNFAWFVVFLFSGGLFIHLALRDVSIGAVLFASVCAIACFIAAYRFIYKAAMSEQLFIGSGELRVIKKSFTIKTHVFDLAAISNFRHLEKSAPSRHPLAGESFDSLGFQTQQVMIRELHGDNRVAFDYDGWVMEFGENIYSWEFEELATLVAAAGGDVMMPEPSEPVDPFGPSDPLGLPESPEPGEGD